MEQKTADDQAKQASNYQYSQSHEVHSADHYDLSRRNNGGRYYKGVNQVLPPHEEDCQGRQNENAQNGRVNAGFSATSKIMVCT